MKDTFSLFKTANYKVEGEADTDIKKFILKVTAPIEDGKEYRFDLITGEKIGSGPIGISTESMNHISKVLKLKITEKDSLFEIAIKRINKFYKTNIEDWKDVMVTNEYAPKSYGYL